jgi:polysaccharide biosynthesis protein PelF
MSIGLPVIATDVGSISEVINEKSGILIPAKDVGKLSDAITTMFNDQENRQAMGLEAKRILKADFDVSVWYSKWAALYD